MVEKNRFRRGWNIEHNNQKCEICKKMFLNPLVHHIDGNHKNNKESNKVIVCKSCHLSIHNNKFSKYKEEIWYYQYKLK